jgi:hypothetical protein
MKKVLYILLFISVLLFASCKKCKTCKCWKNGVEYEEKNCSYGFPPTTRTLNVWEDYLIEKTGYDSIKCVME